MFAAVEDLRKAGVQKIVIALPVSPPGIEDEFLRIVELKMKDALAYIKNGKLKDAKTIIGILLSRDYLNGNTKIIGKDKK